MRLVSTNKGEVCMSNNQITKEALASALKDLLKEQPLSKISVKSITNYCNISRNTFYYHFKDKYELINWIFYTDMLHNVNSFDDPSKLLDSFVSVCKCLYTNRKFYLACFQYVGQNSLYESLFQFYFELWKINIDVRYTNSGFKLTEAELDLMAKLKAHALVGVIEDWVHSGMSNNYMTYFEQIHSVMELDSMGYSALSNQQMIHPDSNETPQGSPQKRKYEKVC